MSVAKTFSAFPIIVKICLDIISLAFDTTLKLFLKLIFFSQALPTSKTHSAMNEAERRQGAKLSEGFSTLSAFVLHSFVNI